MARGRRKDTQGDLETGETYGEFLTGLATESGIQTPTAQELVRLDRKRKGKQCGNDECHNPNDPDAMITKMKDGRTHLAYKPEQAIDLDTGAIVAAEIHPADQGDTTTLSGTLGRAVQSLGEVRDDDTVSADTTGLMVKEVVADKGYHSSQTLVVAPVRRSFYSVQMCIGLRVSEGGAIECGLLSGSPGIPKSGLTTETYQTVRLLDARGARTKLPSPSAGPERVAAAATGTDHANAGAVVPPLHQTLTLGIRTGHPANRPTRRVAVDATVAKSPSIGVWTAKDPMVNV
ncbi:MAG: hypothetical protein IID40_06665 [Planctomycetes bacterium]|nr:hypothetical protein [Planctomycetota bacterium]